MDHYCPLQKAQGQLETSMTPCLLVALRQLPIHETDKKTGHYLNKPLQHKYYFHGFTTAWVQ